MNIRRMTIGGVFTVVGGVAIATLAADERGAVINPLRVANRNPPAAVNPRPQPDLWRNPASLRPSDTLPDSRPERESHAAAATSTPRGPDAGRPSTDQPQRTLIQRIRERRLAQLEKQAERLRQLSAGENSSAPSRRGSANPNGLENPDVQIDLGTPVDSPRSSSANPLPDDAPQPLLGPSAVGPPSNPRSAAGTPSPELNPPQRAPVEVNIELPDDVQPPQPQPPAQARAHNWWSTR